MAGLHIQQAFDLALQHHQAGRLAEAEAIYRQILAQHPAHADALHYLGLLAHQVGQGALAVDLIHQAITLSPNNPAYCSNLGLALRKLGRLDEAAAAYRQAIALNPNLAAAYGNLGVVLADQGRFAEAIVACSRAVQLRPDYAEAHNNLGSVFRTQGRFDEAISACSRAIQLQPGYVAAHNNLGNALTDLGRPDDAAAAYRRAIEIDPNDVAAHSNLGNALREQGHLSESLAECHRAINLRPDYAAAHTNLGNTLSDLGRFADAAAAYRRSLEIAPLHAATHDNLGNALRAQGQFDAAIAAHQRAVELDPSYAHACNNLAVAFREQCRFEEAVLACRRALEIQPDFAAPHTNLGNAFKDQGLLGEAVTEYRRAIEVKADYAEAHSNLIYTLHFQQRDDDREIAAEHGRWNRQFAEPLRQMIAVHPNAPDPERRLRVGYVSPDFSGHVICHFLLPLLDAHDRSLFEIHCYASVKRPDIITARMRKTADVWHDVLGVRDAALAKMIREDGIDILVDLTQHMADNRLQLFARKPAPVQVAWLGYPGTTGLHAMDCRLTDSHMEPEGVPWSQSVERAVRLPDSWFCFDPIDDFPPPGDLPALRSGHVTFGCLNNFCKVSDDVLLQWVRVMSAIEGSRLLLRCPAGAAQDRVRTFFASHGIAPDRLDLVAWTKTRLDFLDLFGRIDIVLDPFPYNGGTTTCEALWMGIPVLTLPGNLIVARIGLSILSAAGMPEFVASSESDLIRLAKSLASDLPRLAHLRSTLRERMKASPFMDGQRFARNVEHAYRDMWRTWCAAQQPSLSPDAMPASSC